MSTLPGSPYKGLAAFDDSDVDALFFFGREREREIVVANLIASRLTVLYGPSGVGKSSLLGAGVARSLRELPEEPAVVMVARWSDVDEVALEDAVAAGEAADRDVYVVLDQLEEYFLYSGEADTDGLGAVLARLLDPSRRVNVLLSLRDDELARLDRFKGVVPGLFSNVLRLDRLQRAAGRDAVLRPVERWNELTGDGVSVEPTLVEAVLDEVGSGRVEQAFGGRSAGDADGAGRIEAPFLQLVMERLWHVERTGDTQTLREATLRDLGGASRIVSDHFEHAVQELTPAQQEVTARLFHHLVTPSGTKIAHAVPDLTEYVGADEAALRSVLASLAERRILRRVDLAGTRDEGYEIFHDVLADPVLAWRGAFESERALADVRRRHRRAAAVATVALAALVVVAAIAIYALTQRAEAREQARNAQSRELAAASLNALDSDPELSVLLAVEAARRERTRQVEDVLRQALVASRVRAVLRGHDRVVAAHARDGAVVTVDRSGRLRAFDQATSAVRRSAAVEGDVAAAAFARDVSLVAVAVGSGVEVWDTSAFRRVARAAAGEPVAAVALSPDGRGLAWVTRAGLVRVGPRKVRVAGRPTSISLAAGVAVVAAGPYALVFDARTLRRLARIEDRAQVIGAAPSPDGRLVATAAADSGIRLWEAESGRLVNVFLGHGNLATGVRFDRSGQWLVSWSKDATARIWDTETARPVTILAGHRSDVTSAAFAGGGSLVTGGADGTARVWDSGIAPDLRVLARLGRPVVRLDVAGSTLRVATDDERVHVLDTRGREVRVERAPPATRIARGPNGEEARIVGKVIELRAGGELYTLRGHRDDVMSASFSRDGRRLVTASRDHDARIWNVADGRLVRVLAAHFAVVSDASFSPDGRWVVTAGPSTAGLWRSDTGAFNGYLRGHADRLTGAAFTPDGAFVVTTSLDGTVRRFRCELCGGLEQLTALAQRRLERTGRRLTPAERRRYLGG